MNSIYDGFRVITERGWFAGANTEGGFSGAYPEIADEGRLRRLYIIKGGSGTGKSTMIRRLGEAAVKAGRRAEFYYCGSDPDSLDGVVIDEEIAMVDGTAPHVLDMKFPGAASELVDVSPFWDCGLLESRREEIVAHSALKGAEFASAYRWLGAAGLVLREEEILAGEIFLREKAENFAARLVKRLGKPSGNGIVRRRYAQGVTMRGRCGTDGIRADAEVRYVVEDCGGTARLFLPVLAEALRRAGWDTTVGTLPLCGIVSGVRAGKFSFTVGRAGEGDAPVRMSRFTRPDPELRGRLRLDAKLRESCLEEADRRLAAAAEHHFALEEIYRPAMDFRAKERYEKKLIGRIIEGFGNK